MGRKKKGNKTVAAAASEPATTATAEADSKEELNAKEERDPSAAQEESKAPSSPEAASPTEKDVTGEQKKATLQMALERRPSLDELEQRGVIGEHELRPAEAPLITHAKAVLEPQIIKNNLSGLIATRPEIEELERAGILPADSVNVDPSLQHTRHKLSSEMTKDTISKMLRDRPTVDELAEHGIIHAAPETGSVVAPAIQSVRDDLSRNMTRNNLARNLRQRPSLTDMEQQHWFAAALEEEEQGDSPGAPQYQRHRPLSKREKYALALKAAARLTEAQILDKRGRSLLKGLVLSDDKRVMGAVAAYEADMNLEKMMASLSMIVRDTGGGRAG